MGAAIGLALLWLLTLLWGWQRGRRPGVASPEAGRGLCRLWRLDVPAWPNCAARWMVKASIR